MLRNHITERNYGIILRNHPYEKDPGDAWDVPGDPWDPCGPLGTPLGGPGTPLGPPGTPLGSPRDVPETPQEPLGPPGDLQGPLMDRKNIHISTNIQRQNLSIAVFEAACWGPSHKGLDQAILSIKHLPK